MPRRMDNTSINSFQYPIFLGADFPPMADV
jgi:hypothetical protein